jgi:hypothetical protein
MTTSPSEAAPTITLDLETYEKFAAIPLPPPAFMALLSALWLLAEREISEEQAAESLGLGLEDLRGIREKMLQQARSAVGDGSDSSTAGEAAESEQAAIPAWDDLPVGIVDDEAETAFEAFKPGRPGSSLRSWNGGARWGYELALKMAARPTPRADAGEAR